MRVPTKKQIKKAVEERGDDLTWWDFVYCIKNGIHAKNVEDRLVKILRE